VLSGNLYGIDLNGQAFRFENKTAEWIKLSKNLPLSNSIPIFENDKYICYSVCHGEWGGYVFFYNKQTGKITFVQAGHCAVSLMEQESGGFYIVSNGSWYSNIKKIENPDSLFKLPDSLVYNNDDDWDKKLDFRSMMFADTANYHLIHAYIYDENGEVLLKPVYVYENWENTITAGFKIKDENYFIAGFRENNHRFRKKYLTKLHGDSLIIVNTTDTIFSGLPSRSHGEITRTINNNIVIDYTLFAGEPNHRNLLLTTFIINDTTLIRINWIDWSKVY